MLGCSRPTAPEAPPPAPAADAARPVDAHRWTDAQLAEIARRRVHLTAMQAEMRRRHFAMQGHIEPPAAFPTDLRGVWPPGVESKVTSVGLHRRMSGSRPADTDRLMTRWVTPLSASETRAALLAHLRATGWLGPKEPLRFPVAVPQRGTLDAEVIEHPERATAVQLTLRRPAADAPLQTAKTLLSKPPAWLPPANEIIGFEFDHHHGVVPHGSFSDVLRFAVVLGGDRATQFEALKRRLAENGYTADPKHAEVYRDGHGATCRAEATGERLVIHHQRRWKR